MKLISKSQIYLFLPFFCFSLSAISQSLGDEKYKPDIGQTGKDVIWVPTPDQLVDKMLATAKVTDKDLVYDLGAGDGKIAIAAALKFGAKSVGIEYNPDMAAYAQRNVERAGVQDRVRIIRGDIFEEDFSTATVVTLYLLPDLNIKLKPILQKMKAGTRVVSNSFSMGDWDADEVIEVDRGQGFFWIVPARIEGRWDIRISGQKGLLELNQKNQKFEGSLRLGGKTFNVTNGHLRGASFTFDYERPDQSYVKVGGTVDGPNMKAQQKVLSAAVELNGKRN